MGGGGGVRVGGGVGGACLRGDVLAVVVAINRNCHYLNCPHTITPNHPPPPSPPPSHTPQPSAN